APERAPRAPALLSAPTRRSADLAAALLIGEGDRADRVSALPCRSLDRTQGAVRPVLHRAVHDHADAHGALGGQRAGDRATGVVRLLDGLQHPGPGRFPDIRMTVEHAGDGHM